MSSSQLEKKISVLSEQIYRLGAVVRQLQNDKNQIQSSQTVGGLEHTVEKLQRTIEDLNETAALFENLAVNDLQLWSCNHCKGIPYYICTETSYS